MADGHWLYTGDPSATRVAGSQVAGSSSDETASDAEDSDADGSLNDAGRFVDPMASNTDPHTHNRWRLTPNTTLYNPFVNSMIRTVTRGMPSLREFCFDTHPVYVAARTIAFQLAETGSRFIWNLDHDLPPDKQEDESLRRFKIWVGPEWEVPEELLAMGRDWVGETGVVRTTKLWSK